MFYNATLLAYFRIKGRAKRSSVLANTTYPAAKFDALRNQGKLGLSLTLLFMLRTLCRCCLPPWGGQALMRAHLHDSLNLDELAVQFTLSRFHFAKPTEH